MQNIHMRTWLAIAASIVVIGYVFWQGVWSPIANSFSTSANTAASAQTNNANLSLPITNNQNTTVDNINQQANIPNLPDNQIGIIDVKIGDGQEAKAGDTVQVHYDGYLTNGTKFDSSRARGTPFTFTLGTGQVIPGFDKGITGMKVGSIRRIVIPPKLGYGDQQAGSIPPNSTLLFEVELVKVGK